MIPHAPGVQMQPIPSDGIQEESDDEDDKHNSDQRISSNHFTFFFLDINFTLAIKHPIKAFEFECFDIIPI